MDERLLGTFTLYSMRQVAKGLIELEGLIAEGSREALKKQRDVLNHLVGTTRRLIEGRDEGYINNVRMLQMLKFLNDEEALTALKLYSQPQPERDFNEVVALAQLFAERMPKFKEDVCC